FSLPPADAERFDQGARVSIKVNGRPATVWRTGQEIRFQHPGEEEQLRILEQKGHAKDGTVTYCCSHPQPAVKAVKLMVFVGHGLVADAPEKIRRAGGNPAWAYACMEVFLANLAMPPGERIPETFALGIGFAKEAAIGETGVVAGGAGRRIPIVGSA